MNFKTSSIVIFFLLVSFNSHSQLDFFVKMNEKFNLEIKEVYGLQTYTTDLVHPDHVKKIIRFNYPKFSSNGYGSREKLQKQLTKYQKKNSEDFTIKFFNYLLKIYNIEWSFEEHERRNNTDVFIDKSISNLKLQYDIIKEIKKLSPSELEIFSKYYDFKFLEEFLKYYEYFIWTELRKSSLGDVDSRIPLGRKLYFYNLIKDDEMFTQEFKTVVLVSMFSDFRSKLFNNNSVVDSGIGREGNVRSEYLRNISPEVDFESNWIEKYPFIDEDFNSKLSGFSEYFSQINFWIQNFKDIENIDKEKLGEKNKLFYELMKSDSYVGVVECDLIFEHISNPSNFDKKDWVLIGEFLQNTNCYELNDDYNDKFKKIKYRYDNVLKSLTNNTKGYCTREKHEERIEKEYYPDNGLKITRGIIRIILKESGNCKYSWEVYDTSLLGKIRISYFITKSDNPEDSTISIELIEPDEF